MNKYLLPIIIFISINTCIYSQVWMQSYNGSGNGNDVSNAVTIDGSNNIYITGYTTGIGNSKNIVTLKYDPSGALQWSAVYNGSNSDEAYAITLDASNNVYITGYSTGSNSGRDIITIKYNNSGVQQWATRYTSPDNYPDEAYAITLDNAGNILIAGYSYDHDLDNEMTLIKYNSSGVQQWAAKYDGSSNKDEDVAYAITVDAANNVYIAGASTNNAGNKDFTTLKYNSSGVQQWAKKYNGTSNNDDEAYAITLDASNNVYVTGYSSETGHGKDYLTVKYNSSGTQQWASAYNNAGANKDDVPRSILVANNNDVIVTGSSMSSASLTSQDYLTIKYNPSDGSEVFEARYNDSLANSSDIAIGIGVPSSNNAIYITGSSRQSSIAGSEDIVTLKYNPSGNLQQKLKISNPGYDSPTGIAVDANKDFVLTGFLSTPSNGYNMLTAKYLALDNLTSIINTGNGIPESFALYQNYPNPFNPSTNIKFNISKSSIVRIVIYDALGREVLTPVRDFLNAGYYEVSVPMGGLSSGLYFYKMTSDGFTDIKKMILIK